MKNECNIQIELELDNKEIPLFQQIAEGLQQQICSGILKPDDMLPSSRTLAAQLKVSRKTIVRATEILLLRGELVAKDRSGLYVARPSTTKQTGNTSCRLPTGISTEKCIENRGTQLMKINDGFPDTRLLPFLEFTRAYRKLFNRAAQWKSLGYNSPMGYQKFRSAIASMLRHLRSLAIDDEEVCIVRGSQMALYLVAHSVLTRGHHIAIESPGYGKAYETFLAAGLIVHRVPIDANGICVDELAKLCKQHPLKAVYLTPRHQYPTTVKLSMSRRQQIKQLSLSCNLLVIEDDFGADFQYNGSRLLPLSSMLDKSHYIYISTFSKIFAPAIRVGYVASSSSTIEKIADYRRLVDIQGDTVQEHALYEMLENGVINRHIRRSSRIYRERLEHATQEIQRLLGNDVQYRRPHGGLALWLSFSSPTTQGEFGALLRQKGMELPIFSLDDGTVGVRIGYASLSSDEMTHVIETLSKVIQKIKSKE